MTLPEPSFSVDMGVGKRIENYLLSNGKGVRPLFRCTV